ncbi:hypothetical protein McanMca71_004250 [Microsporum canis]
MAPLRAGVIASSFPLISIFRPPLSRQLTRTMATQAIEEQALPFYYEKDYYPVKIGQLLNDRYRIIAKLGYGAYSTVWLASDEKTKEYKTLKATVQVDNARSLIAPVLNEVNMLQRMKSLAEEDHPGLDFIRLAQDIFAVNGPTGRHYCIVSKPQGNSAPTLQEMFPNGVLPRLLVKSIVHHLLFSVNWLHTICGLVHTDISPQNILMDIGDDTTSLKDVEYQEAQDPSVPIITKDGNGIVSSIVYKSRPTLPEFSGHPILTDFGQMRQFEGCGNSDWWMPDLYRAPEVLLGLPWSFPVDIWSIGVMTLELMEGKNLFDPVDRVNRQYVLPLAMAQYIGYLGLPPREMVEQSPLFSTYFDADGEAPIPKTSFEEFVTTIPPGKEKDMFLRFIRKALTWDQDARKTSFELITDEWLTLPPEEIQGGIGIFGSS